MRQSPITTAPPAKNCTAPNRVSGKEPQKILSAGKKRTRGKKATLDVNLAASNKRQRTIAAANGKEGTPQRGSKQKCPKQAKQAKGELGIWEEAGKTSLPTTKRKERRVIAHHQESVTGGQLPDNWKGLGGGRVGH